MKKKYSLIAMITLALAASALTCIIIYFAAGRGLGVFTSRFESVRRFGVLLEKIDELYIGSYDSEEMSDNAMRGAVYGLGDDWSYYLSAEEYSEYINYSNNEFVGIGIDVEIDEAASGMRVLSIYPDSPAATAGIVVTDIITAIDGMPLAGLDLAEIGVMMDRAVGETMDLTVLREDGNIVELVVEYTFVYKDPVSYGMLPDGTGYIALENFEYGSASGFIYAIKELCDEGASAFIFDVRTNNGGKVSEMTYILDYLLPKGDIFVDVDKYGRESVTRSDDKWLDMPAVVLVNEYSYSAAEYFAAMLSEYGYAQSVGERTTGKNRSQVTIELPWGGALHISSAEYRTKNRVSLFETEGYTPDFVIDMSDDEYMQLYNGTLDIEDDLQMQKALELLHEMKH